jgi:uncharacterized membrane protein SpoIIM required for sporulation
MGLAFASLIMQPFVSKLLNYEEDRSYRTKRISRGIFRDHSQTFKTILLLFFGIMLAYSALYLYSRQVRVQKLFGSQIAPYCITLDNREARDLCLKENVGYVKESAPYAASSNIAGGAGRGGCETQMDCFFGYIMNNLVVMLVVVILSSAYGAGAMLFLGWNASVWGTVFAYIAVDASAASGAKTQTFLSLFLKIFPHTFLEASAYFLAVIAGIVITKAYLREKMGTKRFNFVIMDGLLFFLLSIIVVVLAAAIEAFIYPMF